MSYLHTCGIILDSEVIIVVDLTFHPMYVRVHWYGTFTLRQNGVKEFPDGCILIKSKVIPRPSLPSMFEV